MEFLKWYEFLEIEFNRFDKSNKMYLYNYYLIKFYKVMFICY